MEDNVMRRFQRALGWILFVCLICSLAACGAKEPNSVPTTAPTTIPTEAFYYCASLKTVKLTDGVKVIGKNAFSNCTSLEDLWISSTLTEIKEGAFGSVRSLSKIHISDLTSWFGITSSFHPLSNRACSLYNGETEVTEITVPEDVTSIPAYSMKFKNVVKVTIPEGVENIGNYAFNGCTALIDINLPQSLTHVGNRLFEDCPNLAVTTFAKGNYLGSSQNPYLYLHSVSDTSIERLNVHDNAAFIGSYALNECTLLEDIYINNGVKQMCEFSITGAGALKEIEFDGYGYEWSNIVKDVTVTNYISMHGATVNFLKEA